MRLRFGAGLEPLADVDQADDQRCRVEIGCRRDTRAGHRRRPEGDDRRIQPRRAGAQHDEGAHGGRAVDGRPDGAFVVAVAKPELDQRGGHEEQQVELRHWQQRRGAQGGEHHQRTGPERGESFPAQPARLARAQLVELVGVSGQARDIRGTRRLLTHSVTRGLDRMHQFVAAHELRVETDGRLFRRQVHAGLCHAAGLAQETLDAIRARRAGHALDWQRQLDGRQVRGQCLVSHTPR